MVGEIITASAKKMIKSIFGNMIVENAAGTLILKPILSQNGLKRCYWKLQRWRK
jgi:hypothetical protein